MEIGTDNFLFCTRCYAMALGNQGLRSNDTVGRLLVNRIPPRPTVLVECPHCQTRVDPSHRNGICAKCNGTVNEIDGVNPNRALLVMRATGRMPEVCCQCGMPTTEMTSIATQDDHSAAVYGLMATKLFSPFVWVINQLRSFAKTGQEPVSLHVPHCEFCDASRFNAVALHPSEDLYQCAVHIDFKTRYDDLNHSTC